VIPVVLGQCAGCGMDLGGWVGSDDGKPRCMKCRESHANKAFPARPGRRTVNNRPTPKIPRYTPLYPGAWPMGGRMAGDPVGAGSTIDVGNRISSQSAPVRFPDTPFSEMQCVDTILRAHECAFREERRLAA
jgi:hypothetical protein